MKIIGHRGAAGLALENTLESIRSATKAGVDAIEVDVRVTKDGHVVLAHDKGTKRVSDEHAVIHESSLEELRLINLHNGKRIPTLHEAIRAAGDTPLVIEAKGSDWAQPLASLLKKHGKNRDLRVISFNHRELFTFTLLGEGIPVYALERTSPFDALHNAQLLGFQGVDLNFWTLNPLVYWWARRSKLEVVVYTVNQPWMARFLRFLYPNISITTDMPHKMGFLSEKSLQEQRAKKPQPSSRRRHKAGKHR
jgi:glycerophosphoryl diester phosphodiesterase